MLAKIPQINNINFKQHQLLCSNDADIIDGMQFDRKMNLSDALNCVKNEPKLASGVAGDKSLLAKFIKDISKIQDLPFVSKLLNSGSSAIVFETDSGDILKLSCRSHFPNNRPHAKFDVPLFKTWKQGNTHVYLEEKLYQHGLSPEFVDIVVQNIKQSGYKPTDLSRFDTHQIGISKKGNLYLLDAEFARYKNIFKAIFSSFIQLFKIGK